MKKTSLTLFLLVSAGALFAADNAPQKKPAAGGSRYRFSLLPKSFQKNPQVDFNVITEVTPAGKKVKPASKEKPQYYVLQAGYYQNLGEAAPANAKPPPVELLHRAMKEALAANGYLEAEPPEHPPRFVVVFNYGDHSATSAELEVAAQEAEAQAAYQEAVMERINAEASMTEEERDKLPPMPDAPTAEFGASTAEELLPYVLADQLKSRQLIDRAALIGGNAFARELAGVLKDEVKTRRASNSSTRAATRQAAERERQNIANIAAGAEPETPTGIMPTFNLGAASPFYRYYRRDDATTHLIDEAFSSCYFVIASAYDGAAMAKGERKLLWRTKMTVNSSGVSMVDTLPTLIGTAGPYFGRETPKVVVVTKKVVREGKVSVGAASVVEPDVPASQGTPALPKSKAETPPGK